jgi:hypothetical protein
MRLPAALTVCCLLQICFFTSISWAQSFEGDTLCITIIQENKQFHPDTMTLEISTTHGNWLRVDAFMREHHIVRHIQRHRVIKFMKKFHEIPEHWRDCDFCPMTTITIEGRGQKLMKRSPENFSRPKKLKRILKIWK